MWAVRRNKKKKKAGSGIELFTHDVLASKAQEKLKGTRDFYTPKKELNYQDKALNMFGLE